MILDNLTRALKTQNWLAAGLEFVIVLAGVVAGFQISAWAEARAEREREALLLARLEADFAALNERAAQSLELCASGQANAEALAELLVRVDDEDLGVVVGAVRQSLGTQVPFGRSPTYVELLASGEMALIRSETLRAALVEYDQAVERQSRAYDSLSVLVLDNAGILLETVSLASAPNADQFESEILDRFRSAEFASAVQTMRQVNARSCFWFGGVETVAERVLSELEAEA